MDRGPSGGEYPAVHLADRMDPVQVHQKATAPNMQSYLALLWDSRLTVHTFIMVPGEAPYQSVAIQN